MSVSYTHLTVMRESKRCWHLGFILKSHSQAAYVPRHDVFWHPRDVYKRQLYAPAGMTYGKINNSFIVALLQTTTDEAAEFSGMIPVYHFLVSAATVSYTHLLAG